MDRITGFLKEGLKIHLLVLSKTAISHKICMKGRSIQESLLNETNEDVAKHLLNIETKNVIRLTYTDSSSPGVLKLTEVMTENNNVNTL